MDDATQEPKAETLPKVEANDQASGAAPTTIAASAMANAGIGATMSPTSVDALFDIQVSLSILVGQRQMRLKDIMKLSKDNIIELDKLAGDPLDIMVNGALIAHGEIVVTNDKYGIRITDIATQSNG